MNLSFLVNRYSSGVNPDPVGSETFCRIRKNHSGSGQLGLEAAETDTLIIRIFKQDPDPEPKKPSRIHNPVVKLNGCRLTKVTKSYKQEGKQQERA
jgi:hypothetical protein